MKFLTTSPSMSFQWEQFFNHHIFQFQTAERTWIAVQDERLNPHRDGAAEASPRIRYSNPAAWAVDWRVRPWLSAARSAPSQRASRAGRVPHDGPAPRADIHFYSRASAVRIFGEFKLSNLLSGISDWMLFSRNSHLNYVCPLYN